MIDNNHSQAACPDLIPASMLAAFAYCPRLFSGQQVREDSSKHPSADLKQIF